MNSTTGGPQGRGLWVRLLRRVDSTPKARKATEAHVERVTPSFPGNRSQAYQARAPGNGNGEACDGGCHLLRCRRRVLQTASLPNAAPGHHSHSAGAQERRHPVRFPTFKPEEKPNLNRTSIILIFFQFLVTTPTA